MIKISLTILTVYLIYYAGNILYDLFLKKEKGAYKEESQEFSLSEISEQYEELTATIRIEDVENIKTPKSFNIKELIPIPIEEANERQDLEYLKEKFESEQDLEEPEKVSKKDSTETENQSHSVKSESSETYPEQREKISNEQKSQQNNKTVQASPITADKDARNSRIKEIEERDSPVPLKKGEQERQWKKMLYLSETLVQMVANYEGHKVYHSTM
jgi:hypothetical protein